MTEPCKDPGWQYHEGRGLVCTGCQRSICEMIDAEMESPSPETVALYEERLANHVRAFQSLSDMSPKQLVDLVLEHGMEGLTNTQELLIEELCSRVYPNWKNES